MNTESPSATAGDIPVSTRNLTKTFVRAGGEEVRAVDDVSLDVLGNEILVLLGPSGCGKSTLLRCIAGLEHPDRGTLTIGGKVAFDAERSILVPPNKRDVNMMFQSYALWPHMTLEDNVAYPLRVAGERKSAARGTANEYLALVGLEGLGKQYAGNVSGGQSQRAALARTLIAKPAVVLFDEPLSNVDAKVRSRLRGELLRLHAELGFSAVYVTHDQIEAMGIGTRIAVMRQGRIDQLGSPLQIYERPSSRYAAEFIGEVNILEGEVSEMADGRIRVDTEIGVILAHDSDLPTDSSPRPGSNVLLMLRPEYCVVTLPDQQQPTNDNVCIGEIATSIYAGSHTEYTVSVDETTLTVWEMAASRALPVGTRVTVRLPPEHIHIVED